MNINLKQKKVKHPPFMRINGCIFINIDTSLNSQVKLGKGVLVHVKGKRTIGVQTKKGVSTSQNSLC
jgi:hypothetical protein